jgi:chromosome segregation ATPase
MQNLERENQTLKAENKELREEINILKKLIEMLIEEIEKLNAKLGKNSSNSSKPPSTDGFRVIPKTREKSELSSGGQKGHDGHRLALPENIEELKEMGLLYSNLKRFSKASKNVVY